MTPNKQTEKILQGNRCKRCDKKLFKLNITGYCLKCLNSDKSIRSAYYKDYYAKNNNRLKKNSKIFWHKNRERNQNNRYIRDKVRREMEILEDHVHLFVKTKPTSSPHWIVQQLKGFSSHQLRKEYPQLKSRLPTLWTRSYYCESVGHISEDTVKKYIEDQTGK